ncbi:unnamed protein product [Linum trigynum]
MVRIQTSRLVKPLYDDDVDGGSIPPPTTDSIPLNIFDKVTYNTHMAVLYAYRPPTPSNATIELALRKVLATYRVMAGQLAENQKGNPVILLNDHGVKFVEAVVHDSFDKFLPLEMSPLLLDFHPELNHAEEITLVQLTRFGCGSLVLGYSSHHHVADAFSASNFLVAWGRAARGLELGSVPSMDRSIFWPRVPPEFGFDHIGVEYRKTKTLSGRIVDRDRFAGSDIVNHKVHFTLDFIAKLKARASAGRPNGVAAFSTFVSLVAHLWRAITKARGLSPIETTSVRISVNGRTRLSLDPPVPSDFYGNLVLWAFPTARAKELVSRPTGYAAKIIQDAIVRVDDAYFKSFIDFASQEAAEGEDGDLVPTADMGKAALWPDLEVDSWLRFPFYELDFGGGGPFIFMPSYYPTEGMMFLLPSFLGDGSVDAVVPLFRQNSAVFKQICYSLD